MVQRVLNFFRFDHGDGIATRRCPIFVVNADHYPYSTVAGPGRMVTGTSGIRGE